MCEDVDERTEKAGKKAMADGFALSHPTLGFSLRLFLPFLLFHFFPPPNHS